MQGPPASKCLAAFSKLRPCGNNDALQHAKKSKAEWAFFHLESKSTSADPYGGNRHVLSRKAWKQFIQP